VARYAKRAKVKQLLPAAESAAEVHIINGLRYVVNDWTHKYRRRRLRYPRLRIGPH
jgi:hypothetical protein